MSNVLITSASRGLGLEFARQYAREGRDVIGCCRHPKAARPLADLGADVVKLDVPDARDSGRIFDYTGKELPVKPLLAGG
jgi:NAD(P)-dependent dehydrogenase (short-subunit alcohol dehydrogenase family)